MGRRFARVRSVALDLTPVRDSIPYRALWTGLTISLIGTNMRVVAVAWHVFQLTHSSIAVGLVGLAEVLPLIALSIVGGTMADRSERRSLVVRMQVGMMTTTALLALLALVDRPPLIAIYLLVAVAAGMSAIERPSRTAMVPDLVPEGTMPAALALRQLSFQTTQIVGPAIAGVLLANFDVALVYAIDSATFLAALIALRWVPPNVPSGRADVPPLESLREGVRFAWGKPLVLSIFVIDLVAMIFGMPRAVFPALAERVFDIGAGGVGMLYAAPSVGAVLGALTTGWVPRVRRQGLAVVVAVVAWGTAIALAGLSTFSLLLTLFFLAAAGFADAISAVFRGTMLYEVTPAELWGRVSSVNLMVVVGGPLLGDVEAGVLAGFVGAPASVLIGGLACIVGAGVVALVSPLRSYERKSSPLT